jgi:hypothetical protein
LNTACIALASTTSPEEACKRSVIKRSRDFIKQRFKLHRGINPTMLIITFTRDRLIGIGQET